MNYRSFIYYDEKEEKNINGAYPSFLNMSLNELKTNRIDIEDVAKIIPLISDNNLKNKMKNKLKELLFEKGIEKLFYEPIFESGIYSNEEIREIINNFNSYNVIKNNSLSSYTIERYLKLYLYGDDNSWSINNITNILKLLINSKDETIVSFLKFTKEHKKDIYDLIMEKHINLVPAYYINYLKTERDNNYIYNKYLEFKKRKVKIGIDPKISIGIEIETNLKNNLIVNFNKQNDISSYYTNGEDKTVSEGTEIISNPFSDNIDDVARLCAVCETLSETGAYYNKELGNASGQINLGLDYLDTPKSIIYFYEIFCNSEMLLFYISNEKDEITRNQAFIRFKPISKIIGKQVINEDSSRNEIISLFDSNTNDNLSYKENTVCIRGEDESLRLEFRIPNGTVSYKTWIDNIRLYGKMMEISKKLSDLDNKDYLSEEEQKLLNLKLKLEEDLPLDDKLNILMDLLFDDETKKIYINRYYSVVKKENILDNIFWNDKSNFDNFSIKQIYESKLDYNGNITYDPKTKIYTNNEKKERI